MAEHPVIVNIPVAEPLIETIRRMPNEFNFSFNCLSTALNEPTTDVNENRNWSSSFFVPESQEPHLFTESVRRALLRLMAVDASFTAITTFQSWFVDNKLTRPLVKTLLDVQTAAYLMRQFQGYDFLRHCAVMSELSALCYYAGVGETPDYAIGCILYAIKESAARNTLDWDSVFYNAECVNKNGEDPNVHYQKLMSLRREVLEGFTSE